MSRALFSRNADLKRLRDEGYFVQVINGFLVMREVPYVDSQKRVHLGTLISNLTMAGDETRRPDPHTVYFDGEYPCKVDGTQISAISHAGGGEQNVYASNIQVADLNCMNAAFAVFRWKRLRGFYSDLEREHNSTFTTDGNLLLNEDCQC